MTLRGAYALKPSRPGPQGVHAIARRIDDVAPHRAFHSPRSGPASRRLSSRMNVRAVK